MSVGKSAILSLVQVCSNCILFLPLFLGEVTNHFDMFYTLMAYRIKGNMKHNNILTMY